MVKVCGGLAPTARPLLSPHLCQASSEATSQGSGPKETDDEHSDGIVLHNARHLMRLRRQYHASGAAVIVPGCTACYHIV